MNMKTLAVLILMGLSYAALAQHRPQGHNGSYNGNYNGNHNGNNNQRAPDRAMLCYQSLHISHAEGQGSTLSESEVTKCRALEALARESNGGSLSDPPQYTGTAKNELVCTKAAGYTIDFMPCVSAVKALNVVMNAEAAMLLQQQVRTDLKHRSIQQQATKQAAQGDMQTGMFDASIASNKHSKAMEQEKAFAYSSAVAALASTYTNWPKKDKLIEINCKKVESAEISYPACVSAANSEGAIHVNEDSRGILVSKITEYIAKGAAAGIKMGQFDTAARTVKAAKGSVAKDDQDLMMERCMFNPTDPLCSREERRTSSTPYQGGDFSFGGGAGNSFDMGSGNDDFGSDGVPSTIGDSDVVAGINSPFLDEAKAASGILDPAAAANSMPGGAPPGAGGGGVGGGGGGGAAMLGGDLDGAEKDGDKEANLKATKAAGNYNVNGGAGFQAIKNGKDEANPFASLFDSKSKGGIEEDRSIASGDIDGKASGLFQKISKRYGQIQADKRIEANNLE